MNIRNGMITATCSDDIGARRYRIGHTQDHTSINAAKKKNGLNAMTGKFPPNLNEIHGDALKINLGRI